MKITAENRFVLRLFGAYEVQIGTTPVAGLHLREAGRVLAYLALRHGQETPYRMIAQAFWPAEGRVSAGQVGDFPSVRQALYALRQALGEEAGRLTNPGKGVVLLDLDGANVDLIEFDRLAQTEDPDAWRRAADCHQSPLLNGWMDAWAVEARARRQRSLERLLKQLAEHAQRQSDWDGAEAALRRLVEVSPGDTAQSLLDQLLKVRATASVLPAEFPAGRASGQPSSGPASKQVALLYKRGALPDEAVMRLLERALTDAGYRVFMDRQMNSGVEWAREIEKQICASYAVVPLISAAAVHSEMLSFEIEQAHNAAQHQNGLPRLLPVFVNYREPLPQGTQIASILAPIQYALWQCSADDVALVAEILRALQTPPAPVQAPPRLEPVGGAVPLDSRFYITRPTDALFLQAITSGDSIVLVKGARQMGKTSLLARGLQQAREQGMQVMMTDFQTLHEEQLASPGALYLALATALALQLDLEVMPEETWNERWGANANLEMFLRRQVLNASTGAFVWGLDEVDRLFMCPFGGEVCGLFRSWHNRRSLDPSGPWSRLTLAIAYATEAHLFITDLNQSPFNVGTQLGLDDFTEAQTAELNGRYGCPLPNADAVARFHALIHGQPYLTRRGLAEIAAGRQSLQTLEAEAARDDGPFGDHLRRLLVSLVQDPALTAALRDLLRDGAHLTPEHFYRLRSAGLVSGASSHDARPRCPLYATFLSSRLS